MADKKTQKRTAKNSRWPKIKRKRIGTQATTSVASPDTSRQTAPGKIAWDMLLYWRTSRQPMITQKLGFNAGPSINDAYKEAQKLRTLLVSAGNFKEQDVSLVAVAATAALEKHFKDQRIFVAGKDREMRELVKAAQKKGTNKIAPKDDTPMGNVKTRGTRAKA